MSRGGYPVTIRGITYPSMAEAARQLGVTPVTIAGALNRGTIDNVGTGSNTLRSKPVSYDGEVFSSIAALARNLNINEKNLHTRMSAARRKGKRHQIHGIDIHEVKVMK